MDPPSVRPLHPPAEKQHLIFPGGGIFFWWQAGLVKALQQRYDLQRGDLSMSGASAGSITCVMAACNVDMDAAMNAALRLADEAGVFTRSGGLAGVWGKLIERWLHEMLPDDCHTTCSGKVGISVTALALAFNPIQRKVINTFSSKEDLIDACLTSVHIPYFLDGNFSRTYRGEACVDGSLLFCLLNTPWRASEEFGEKQSAWLLHHAKDEKLMQRKWGFLETLDKDSLVEMFSMGHDHGMGHDRTRSPSSLHSRESESESEKGSLLPGMQEFPDIQDFPELGYQSGAPVAI